MIAKFKLQLIIACILAALALGAFSYVKGLRSDLKEAMAALAVEKDLRITAEKLAAHNQAQYDKEVVNVGQLMLAQKLVAIEFQPINSQIAGLACGVAEETPGAPNATDNPKSYLNQLNGINTSLNRMLERATAN